MKLVLPAPLRHQIESQANASFPRECCGLLEGVAGEDGFAIAALHPARNLAVASDRFEMDPADHIAANKAARGAGRMIIGCYHSHPGGEAVPSRTDRAGAAQEDFLWLIAATDGVQSRLAGFVYRRTGFEGIELMLAADLALRNLSY